MKITQFEQSGLLLETNRGFVLAIDIGSYTPLEKLEGINPDAMLISHLHGDHFSIEHIQALAPKKLYVNRECIELLAESNIESEIIEVKVGDHVMIDDIRVDLFDVDHGPNVKVRPRENFGFLITVDTQIMYFAGDMFTASGIDVSNLEVDVALIPVGTFYTFGPTEALDFIKKFKAIGNVLPMHYQKTPETLGVFTQLATDAGFTVGSGTP